MRKFIINWEEGRLISQNYGEHYDDKEVFFVNAQNTYAT